MSTVHGTGKTRVDNRSRQTSLSEATLLPMGKGFAITTDLNLGEMLLAGYARHCTASSAEEWSRSSSSLAHKGTLLPKIRVAAITNDTVATFVSSAYAVKATLNSRVAMGLIVGTGTNATVPMRPNDLHFSKLDAVLDLETVRTIVVNTEWTIRGTDIPLESLGIKTEWDRILDQNSDAPGFQPFEYMTSGRYLGEIVRLAFVGIISTHIGMHRIPSVLQDKNAIPTRFLSENVARKDQITLQAQLAAKYPSHDSESTSFWTLERVRLLCDLAQAVQQRSSALIAAASIGLLDCVGDINLTRRRSPELSNGGDTAGELSDPEELVIAYTGSTISHYPHWLEDYQQWIDRIIATNGRDSGQRVVLREALDGGIIGAGVLAAMGNRIA